MSAVVCRSPVPHYVSRFTDAYFAATLLECGPHVLACDNCIATSQSCPNATAYQTRVRKYFVRIEQQRSAAPIYDWIGFWREYRAWVET